MVERDEPLQTLTYNRQQPDSESSHSQLENKGPPPRGLPWLPQALRSAPAQTVISPSMFAPFDWQQMA